MTCAKAPFHLITAGLFETPTIKRGSQRRPWRFGVLAVRPKSSSIPDKNKPPDAGSPGRPPRAPAPRYRTFP